MKRSRFSEEQIVGILKEHEAGRKVAELAREHGVSEAMQLPRTVTLAYRRKVPVAAIASSQIRTISFHQFAV